MDLRIGSASLPSLNLLIVEFRLIYFCFKSALDLASWRSICEAILIESSKPYMSLPCPCIRWNRILRYLVRKGRLSESKMYPRVGFSLICRNKPPPSCSIQITSRRCNVMTYTSEKVGSHCLHFLGNSPALVNKSSRWFLCRRRSAVTPTESSRCFGHFYQPSLLQLGSAT
jgi:hypothetical protein